VLSISLQCYDVSCGHAVSFPSKSQTDSQHQVPVALAVRFEILQRDSYSCQFCGRRPPDVTLEVERLRPLLEGGSLSQANLITVCGECSVGRRAAMAKGFRSPEPAQDLPPVYRATRSTSMDPPTWWRDEMIRHVEGVIARLAAMLGELMGEPMSDFVVRDIRNLIRRYGCDTVDACFQDEIVNHAGQRDTLPADADHFREFMVGLTRQLAHQTRGTDKAPDPRLYRIRGVLRSRLKYVREDEVLKAMQDASFAGVPLDMLEQAAQTTRSWPEFWTALSALSKSTGS
jgi:hypothetical protein